MSRNVIVLVFDGLNSAYLGPYGNGWVETPALNELATESLLVEYAMTDSLELQRTYESYWLGCHAMADRERLLPALPQMCVRAEIPFSLFTDDPVMSEHRLLAGVDDVSLLQPGTPRTASELERTLTVELCQLVAEHLTQVRSGHVTWLHSRAMSGPWDAPFDLRQALSDDEDNRPPEWIAPPLGPLDEDFDPDDLWGLSRAYAAQVMAVDFGVGLILDAIADRKDLSETLIILTSPRGFSLGEHGHVGCEDLPAFSEVITVPMLVRSDRYPMVRTHSLSQPTDVFATIANWLGLETSTSPIGTDLVSADPCHPSPIQQRAVTQISDTILLRTGGWLYRKVAGDGAAQLFVKPDDRWDANEIADRCREIVELMQSEIESFSKAVRTGEVASLEPLPDVLQQTSS